MTSTPISPVTLTTGNIVDNQQADAADVTVPFGEVQNNLPANAGYLLSVSPADTHKKHLTDAIQVAGSLTKTIQNAAGDESILLTVTATGGGYPADGRLSPNDEIPDAAGFTEGPNLYYMPYTGDKIALYTGSTWEVMTFTGPTLSVTGLSNNTNYDIFAYKSGSNVLLEAVSWSGNTTRTTALARQNGVLVLSSNATRRYLGSIRVMNNNFNSLVVWNMYNRVMSFTYLDNGFDEASWTYNSTSWRAAAGVNAGIYVLIGWNDFGTLTIDHQQIVEASSNVLIGIGRDTTTGSTMPFGMPSQVITPAGAEIPIRATYRNSFLAPGFYTFYAVEANGASGTFTRKNLHLVATWMR